MTTETLGNISINNLLCKYMPIYINNTLTWTRKPDTWKIPKYAKHQKQEALVLASTSIVQIILITPEQSSEDFLFWEYWDGLSKWMSVGSNLWHKLSESDNWHTQLAFTCSKSTTETLEKGVKHSSKLTIKHQNDLNGNLTMTMTMTISHLFLLFILLTLNKWM